ncbi:hypothetical protein [Curtobacterium sp. Leaf261]|uniref:hypothetical protein n=1 Tax=Curtobacterium sp. Leaf261 TaxID=1736311 RepID=UPI0012E0E510|nr:hypothetical protein [Curtobacterium sp. Leaf261]
MSVNSRRADRPLPEEPYSLSLEAHGVTRATYSPPLPVRVFVQLPTRQVRLDAVAVQASDDAVLVQWGRGPTERQCWVWRAAVKHRR